MKIIKYIIGLCLLMVLSSCAINQQKKDAKSLANEVQAFRASNNTRVEFLTYLDLSKENSYIVDSPILVSKIVEPNIAIVKYKDETFAIEFLDKELNQSFPNLEEGAKVLFQEGILLYTGEEYSDKTLAKGYKKFTICRSTECRKIAKVSIAYIYNYKGVDPTIPSQYKTGDLSKYLVDQSILKEKK